MKAITLLLFVLAIGSNVIASSQKIVSSGFTFSPNTATVNAGDTVNFVLGSIHSAREVSKATWDSNGTTSNGGFDLPLGGGTVVLTQAGVHYYVCVPHASLGMKGTITVNAITGVRSVGSTVPGKFSLMQNFPNPFNPSTIIQFDIPKAANVSLKIYNALGGEVGELVNGQKDPGRYQVSWNATVPSGMYFYQLRAGDFLETKKMLLLR
jgi:plastocyanin